MSGKEPRHHLEVIAWKTRNAAVRSLPTGHCQCQSRKVGAYRSVIFEQAHQRWLNGVPENKKDALIRRVGSRRQRGPQPKLATHSPRP